MTTQTLLNTGETGNTAKLTAIVDLLGRVGLSVIFLLAGISKIQYYEANAQFLASGGLPAELLPLVIAFELIGAILLVVGYQTRLAALAFAGFSVATALLYHNNLADQMQFLLFFKNIAMAGGFLVLAAHGAGEFSIDAKRRK
ncbi:DoxX family protein [Kistimonas asteriae]|uniref:DoxX family protein n=1 Tax=Kistimonas asteriae TaxID=517724 RepID=UPI001BA763BD|nr:DoxX family protein [Kistimonas asteriae]